MRTRAGINISPTFCTAAGMRTVRSRLWINAAPPSRIRRCQRGRHDGSGAAHVLRRLPLLWTRMLPEPWGFGLPPCSSRAFGRGRLHTSLRWRSGDDLPCRAPADAGTPRGAALGRGAGRAAPHPHAPAMLCFGRNVIRPVTDSSNLHSFTSPSRDRPVLMSNARHVVAQWFQARAVLPTCCKPGVTCGCGGERGREDVVITVGSQDLREAGRGDWRVAKEAHPPGWRAGAASANPSPSPLTRCESAVEWSPPPQRNLSGLDRSDGSFCSCCRRSCAAGERSHTPAPPSAAAHTRKCMLLSQWHSEHHLVQLAAQSNCKMHSRWAMVCERAGCAGTWRGPSCGVVAALQAPTAGAAAALAPAAGAPPVTHAAPRHLAAAPIRFATKFLQDIDGPRQVSLTNDVLTCFKAVHRQVLRQWQEGRHQLVIDLQRSQPRSVKAVLNALLSQHQWQSSLPLWQLCKMAKSDVQSKSSLTSEGRARIISARLPSSPLAAAARCDGKLAPVPGAGRGPGGAPELPAARRLLTATAPPPLVQPGELPRADTAAELQAGSCAGACTPSGCSRRALLGDRVGGAAPAAPAAIEPTGLDPRLPISARPLVLLLIAVTPDPAAAAVCT